MTPSVRLLLPFLMLSFCPPALAQVGGTVQETLRHPALKNALPGSGLSYTLPSGLGLVLREKAGYLISASLVAPQGAPTGTAADQAPGGLLEVGRVIAALGGFSDQFPKALQDFTQQEGIKAQLNKGVTVPAGSLALKFQTRAKALTVELEPLKIPADSFPTVKTFWGSTQTASPVVTIRVFSDFQCPYCRQFDQQALAPLLAKKPADLRVEFHHLPLESIHPNARAAAEASECASAQGKFWAYKDALFADATWQKGNPNTAFIALASAQKLEVNAFKNCLAERSGKAAVDVGLSTADKLKLRGTPTVFINNYQISPSFSPVVLEQQIAFIRGLDYGIPAKKP